MIIRAIALGVALTLAPASEPASASEAKPAAEPPPPSVLPPPQVIEVDPRNYRLVLAGDIVIGLGGAGLLTMIVGLGIRSDALAQRRALGVASDPDTAAIARQDRRIAIGTNLAISGGVAAGVLFTTGITLVALGHSRERKRREQLSLLPSPMLGREAVGLRWSLRF